MKTIKIADLFCGAGGTSTGCILAARELGLTLSLLAINHWPIAVATHQANHPWARHLCADLASVDPSKVIPGGFLNLLVASPECTHHSIARGGKPCSDQSRASAWHVLHWAERLRIEHILIENVREFKDWGPLKKNGRQNKRRKGETFNAFLNALRSLGYTVDHRVLNAADYGDATTRRRLFIQASRVGKITWPAPSHCGRWKAASEIIDWSLRGNSILQRKRSLSPNTMARIEAGLRKFGGEPFIAVLHGTKDSALRSTAKSLEEPLPALATSGHMGLCQPFILQCNHGKNGSGSSESRTQSINEPLRTITCEKTHALVEPFIIQTDQTGGHGASVRSVNQPLYTAVTKQNMALIQPFIAKYYGTGITKSVEEPLDTVTTQDRFALVEPLRKGDRLDILFRMLQPHELAEAMGFDRYTFTGNKTEQVKQIGNAVPVNLAKALCKEILVA